MKALQGKKPGLRSLWGKALVVFCLAALVFSGCSEGDSVDSGGGIQKGKDVLRIEVLKSPTEYSLEGMKVDLRGIEVLITYTDQTWTITRDHTLFHTVPNPAARANFNNATQNPIPLAGVTMNGSPITTAAYGAPGQKGGYVIPARGNANSTGYEAAFYSMSLPYDYMFAEYRVLDYYLAYNHGRGETKYAPVRIPGVHDLEEIHFLSGLPNKTAYYIDDVVDLTGLVIELKYNDRTGLYLTDNGRTATVGDRLGTPERVEAPYDARWDWSLNYPRSEAAEPTLRVNIGNRLFYNPLGGANGTTGTAGTGQGANQSNSGAQLGDADYRWEERVNRRDHKLEALYLVDKLEVTKQPSFLAGEPFFSDYELKTGSLREEWLMYLKDAEITVSYKDTKGNPAPAQKKILVDAGGPMTLPMAEYFRGNGFGVMWTAAGTQITQGSPDGPPLFGRRAVDIRGPEPDAANYNPNFSNLVIVHQNVERRFNPNPMQLGWEWNQNPDMVRMVTIGPVKVYTLQTEDDGGSGLKFETEAGETIGNVSLRYPIGPTEADRGSFDRMMGDLKVAAPFIYRDAAGNPDPEMPDTYKDVTKDFRLNIANSRAPVIVDGIRYENPTIGMKQIGFWRSVKEDLDYTFRYTPISGGDYAEGELTLNLFDPAAE